jgi:glycosyltransferase involved in cell wall biosynthesis
MAADRQTERISSVPASVSVIIPTYNCAAFLAEAIRSVLAQTHRAAEIIVVDDGSADDTATVVAGLGAVITYLRQENAGAAAARNAGLARATGDYIAFLDADDYWAPDKLATQLKVMDLCPEVDLVCADFWLAGDDSRQSHIKQKYRLFSAYRLDWPAIFSLRLRLPGTSIDGWMGPAFGPLFLGNFINTSSVLLRRRACDRVGRFSEALRTQEDYDYWLRVARQAECAFVDQPLLAFRRRRHQLTAADQGLRIVQDVLTVIESTAPHALDVLPPSLVAKRLSERCMSVALAFLGARQRSQARLLLHRALSYRPLSPTAGGLMVWSFVPTPVGAAMRKVVAAVKAAA